MASIRLMLPAALSAESSVLRGADIYPTYRLAIVLG
jgi:hypothetical protein